MPTLLDIVHKGMEVSLRHPSLAWLMAYVLPISHPPPFHAEAPTGRRDGDDISDANIWLTFGGIVAYILYDVLVLWVSDWYSGVA